MPPEMVKLPLVPEITPAKVSAALVMVKVLLPKTTEPALLPARLTIEAPLVVPLISKVALFVNWLELASVPPPVKDKVPALIVVLPV